MACEELSLNWNDHHKTLVSVFEKLLEQSTLVDCTIAAEGQYVKAHKVILSACSPYFELLFSQENEKNPIIILKDIKFRELKAMIDFVYRGKVKIPEDHLQDFVDAAESLQIKGLGVDQRKNNSAKRTNEFETFDRKKEKFPPLPYKRFRNSSLNNSEENSHQLSSEVLAVSENVTSESHLHRKTQRNITASSSTFFTHSDTPLFVNREQKRHGKSESNFSCSLEQQVLSSEAVNVFPESGVVVKSEFESVAEVFVPEHDGLVEPKQEECDEEDDEVTVLDDDDGIEQSLAADDIHHQQNSRQLSSFSPMQESILGTDDSYALQHTEHSNTQGGDVSNSSGWQDLHSPLQVAENVFVTSVKEMTEEIRKEDDSVQIIYNGSSNCSPAGVSSLTNKTQSHASERPYYKSKSRRYYADQSASSNLSEEHNNRNNVFNSCGEPVPKNNPYTGDLCDKSCRFYCMDRFSEQDRKCLFDAYNSLDEKGKKLYLLSLMQPSECKKMLCRTNRKRNRSISYRYSVPIGDERKVLCKSAVINMFHISRAKLDILRDKMTYSFLCKTREKS